MSEGGMVGLVLVAHGELARSMLQTAELIAGESERVVPITFGMEEGPDALLEKITGAIERLGGEILLLVDLPGGTPSNVCARLALERGHRVVSGLNLPMLLEVLLGREGESLESVAQTALDAGRQGIIDINEFISKQSRG